MYNYVEICRVLVKPKHFGLVVTLGVSRETSMMLLRVLVQQQLKHWRKKKVVLVKVVS